jgi:sec-independent protein translocase protein TatA
MIGDLFDSPWKIAIIALLIIVMFGSKKLPGAAKSLGQSMRILKSEVTKMHDDDDPVSTAAQASTPFPTAELNATPAQATPAQATTSTADQQTQIDALQQQIRDMQRTAAMDPVPSVQKEATINQQS